MNRQYSHRSYHRFDLVIFHPCSHPYHRLCNLQISPVLCQQGGLPTSLRSNPRVDHHFSQASFRLCNPFGFLASNLNRNRPLNPRCFQVYSHLFRRHTNLQVCPLMSLLLSLLNNQYFAQLVPHLVFQQCSHLYHQLCNPIKNHRFNQHQHQVDNHLYSLQDFLLVSLLYIQPFFPPYFRQECPRYLLQVNRHLIPLPYLQHSLHNYHRCFQQHSLLRYHQNFLQRNQLMNRLVSQRKFHHDNRVVLHLFNHLFSHHLNR